jgi:hypothetical protein
MREMPSTCDGACTTESCYSLTWHLWTLSAGISMYAEPEAFQGSTSPVRVWLLRPALLAAQSWRTGAQPGPLSCLRMQQQQQLCTSSRDLLLLFVIADSHTGWIQSRRSTHTMLCRMGRTSLGRMLYPLLRSVAQQNPDVTATDVW